MHNIEAIKSTDFDKPATYALMCLNSEATKKTYSSRLKVFFDFLKLEGEDLDKQGKVFLDKARADSYYVPVSIMSFIDYQKKRAATKEIAPTTVQNFYKPIKSFLEAHEDVYHKVPWNKLRRAIPRTKSWSNDRAPTIEELRKLVQYLDRRIKPIVYTMCSSGIRLGAWEFLRWKHITPIYDEKTGELLAAKLLVYAGEGEEYISFMTPEAFNAVKEWMDFRAAYGEVITGDSWVMRNIFRTTEVKRVADINNQNNTEKPKRTDNYDYDNCGTGRAKNPIKLPPATIKRIITRALYEQAIRNGLPEDSRRYDFKAVHGMRKFFKTRAEQAMLRTNVEYIIGHNIGISQSYYRPTERELLLDYLKAVPLLTLNDTEDIEALKERQEVLKQKEEAKDRELEELKSRMDIMSQNMASLMKFIATQGKEPLDLVATHVKGVEYANAEEERKSLLQMGEVAREKRKKIGDVDLTLDNVKVKNE
ncbi:MAG TPA: hypothetical protein VFZ55_06315 [Nitrososphaera sp.]